MDQQESLFSQSVRLKISQLGPNLVQNLKQNRFSFWGCSSIVSHLESVGVDTYYNDDDNGTYGCVRLARWTRERLSDLKAYNFLLTKNH